MRKIIPVKFDRDIMKVAFKSRSVIQDVVAEKLGIKRNALSQGINRSRMSLSMFSRVLNALDYDVVVVDRSTGEPMWKLYVEDASEDAVKDAVENGVEIDDDI